MERPMLNEVDLNETMGKIMGGGAGVYITMSIGQWDALLQAAYDSSYTLLELNDDETPIRAYRRRSGGDA